MLYILRKIREEQGDATKAIEHYEKFLDLWKDADSGIAEFEEARNLLKGLITDNNGSKHVFNYFNHSKNDFVPVKSIYIAFSSACKRAKISGLQFRDLRRTFSSWLHELQADPLLIQRLLRHSSFRISEEVYI